MTAHVIHAMAICMMPMAAVRHASVAGPFMSQSSFFVMYKYSAADDDASNVIAPIANTMETIALVE